MKKTVLSYVAGFVTASLLTCGIAYASTTKTLQANYNNIKVYIDNVLADLKDANGSTVEPFICDGTTYLPLRAVANALGCQVEWDGATQSVKLFKDVVPGDTSFVDACPPYGGKYELYSPIAGKTFKMSGENFGNGITINNNENALFNLNGKYSEIICTIGHLEGYEKEASISFVVDGKLVKKVELETECLPKTVTIPLNYGLQLKIQGNNADYFHNEYGIGNMIVK